MGEETRTQGVLERFLDAAPNCIPAPSLRSRRCWHDGLALVDPALVYPDLQLLKTFPGPWWDRYQLTPLAHREGALVVGFRDRLDSRVRGELQAALGLRILLVQLGEGGGPLPDLATLTQSVGARPGPDFRLRRMEVQAHWSALHIHTTLRLSFENPGLRDGVLRLPLDPDASLISYRIAHPSPATRPGQDEAGLSLEIWELPVTGPVEIELEWLQTLRSEDGGDVLRLPGTLNELGVDYSLRLIIENPEPDFPDRLRCNHSARWQREGANCIVSLTEPWGGPAGQGVAFLLPYPERLETELFSDGNRYLLRLRAPFQERQTARDVAIALDRSQSLDKGALDRNRRFCEEMLRGLGSQDRFCLLAFDDRLHLWRQGQMQNSGQRLAALAWLHQTYTAGSNSDPVHVLEWLHQQPTAQNRVSVVLSDGRWGGSARLQRIFQNWNRNHPLHCLGQGEWEGRRLLEGLVTLAGGSYRDLVHPESDARAMTSRLDAPVCGSIRLVGQGFHADPSSQWPGSQIRIFPGQTLQLWGQHHGPGITYLELEQAGKRVTAKLPRTDVSSAELSPFWVRAQANRSLWQQRFSESRGNSFGELLELCQRYPLETLPIGPIKVSRWLEGRVTVGDGSSGREQRLLHWLVTRALERQAHHIHIDVQGRDLRVRMRIHDRLEQLAPPGAELFGSVLSELERSVTWQTSPHQGIGYGTMAFEHGGNSFQLSVSLCPTVSGHSAVIEIRQQSPVKLDMCAEILPNWREILSLPQGFIGVSGASAVRTNQFLASSLQQLVTQPRKCFIHRERWLNLASAIDQTNLPHSAEGPVLDADCLVYTRLQPAANLDRLVAQIERPSLVVARLPGRNNKVSWDELEPVRQRLGAKFLGMLSMRRLPQLCACRVPEKDGVLLANRPAGNYQRPAGCPACYGSGFSGSLLLCEWKSGDHSTPWGSLAEQSLALAREGRVSLDPR